MKSPEERPKTIRIDLTPSQMKRIIEAGFQPGSQNLAQWLVLQAVLARDLQALLTNSHSSVSKP